MALTVKSQHLNFDHFACQRHGLYHFLDDSLSSEEEEREEQKRGFVFMLIWKLEVPCLLIEWQQCFCFVLQLHQVGKTLFVLTKMLEILYKLPNTLYNIYISVSSR